MISQKQLAEMGRHWNPPDHLDQSRPRLTCLTAQGRGALVIALLLFLGSPVVGILLGLKAVKEAEGAVVLQAEGLVTDAQVLRLWRSGDKSRETWVTYRFGNADFSQVEEKRLPLSLWRSLRVGANLAIRYVPTQPEINCPLQMQLEVLPAGIPFLVSGLMLAGGMLPLFFIYREKKFLEQGRVAPALVTSHDQPQRSSHGQMQGQKYHYEFPLLSGAIKRGSSGPVKKPPGIGSLLPVLYDPENPCRNRPYPLTLITLQHKGWHRNP